MIKKDMESYVRKIVKEEVLFALRVKSGVNEIVIPKNIVKQEFKNATGTTIPDIRSKYKQIMESQENTLPKENNAPLLSEQYVDDEQIVLTGHEHVATTPEAVREAIRIQTKDYSEVLKRAR